MAIKLIAMDLDGTLLNSEKIITERTKQAIAAARAKGVRTTIATGRMFFSAEYFGRAIGANAPIICCNGAQVQEMGGEEPVFVRTFAPALMERLLRMADAKGWYLGWFTAQDIYVRHYREECFIAYKTVENFRVTEVGDAYLSYTRDVVQGVIYDMETGVAPLLEEIHAAFPNVFAMQQTVKYSADLTARDMTKAVGLAELAKYYGFSQEEIMVCGDSYNDLAMLEYAGTSVVPANGVDEAKARASYLAPSNDEDGIAYAIEELVL